MGGTTDDSDVARSALRLLEAVSCDLDEPFE
jgi:hypothetical protein